MDPNCGFHQILFDMQVVTLYVARIGAVDINARPGR